MEKTVDHCNKFVDEQHCKIVLVFPCKHDEEKERERERETERERKRQKEIQEQKERERERQKRKERERLEKNKGMMISLDENICAYIKGQGSLCW